MLNNDNLILAKLAKQWICFVLFIILRICFYSTTTINRNITIKWLKIYIQYLHASFQSSYILMENRSIQNVGYTIIITLPKK